MRETTMRKNGKSYLVGLTMGGLLLIGLPAMAQPGPGRGPGPGPGPGPGFGPGPGRGFGPGGGRGFGRCGGMLMRAHPDVLKAKLGLNETQIARVRAIRTNLASKRIKLHAEVQQLRLKQAELFEADLPDQNKVLGLMRQVRGLRGRLAEERIKAHLGVLSVLTKDQRTQLRTQCATMAKGRWGGKGWGRGHGRGRGWGRGPGGGGPGWAE